MDSRSSGERLSPSSSASRWATLSVYFIPVSLITPSRDRNQGQIVDFASTSGNHVTGVESWTHRKPFSSFFHSGKSRWVQSQELPGPQRALEICPPRSTSVEVHSQ